MRNRWGKASARAEQSKPKRKQRFRTRCPRLERVCQNISLSSGTPKIFGAGGEGWEEEALSSRCILDISLKTPEERPDFVVAHNIEGSHGPRLRPKKNSKIQPGPALVELPAQAPHAQPACKCGCPNPCSNCSRADSTAANSPTESFCNRRRSFG